MLGFPVTASQLTSRAFGTPAVVMIAGVAVALTLAALLAGWAVSRQRRNRAVARATRDTVVAELARDPALAELRLRLRAYTEWQGEIIVELAGLVPSPWYRYAVVRAVQRALARAGRAARVVDRLVVSSGNGISRKSAAG